MFPVRFARGRAWLTVLALPLQMPGIAAAHSGPASRAQADQTNLAQARDGCAAKEFGTFFEAFLFSPAVRAQYSAPQVEQRRFDQPAKATGKMLPGSQYGRFNISRVDFYYADTASVERWETDPGQPYTDLTVDIVPLANGAQKVTYQPAIMRDDGEGDSKTLVRHTGKPAAYMFAWQNGCWLLFQDMR